MSLGISNNWEDSSNVNLLAACCCKPTHMNQWIYRYNLYKYNTCICYISLLSMIWAMTYISCHTICIVIDVHQTKWKSYPHMPINDTTPTDFIVSLNCRIFSSIFDDNSNEYKPPYKFKRFNGKLWLLCSLAVMCLRGKTAPPLEAADSLKQTSPQKQIALPLAGLVLYN